MTDWKVVTLFKKNVEEHEIWEKDGVAIRRITGFRWGTFIVTTEDDEEPELQLSDSPYGPGINMWDCGYESQLEFLDDGWFSDVIWPDDMDETERERLEELWDDDPYGSWEDDGWVNTETQVWFDGPLEIKKDGE